MKWVTLVSEDRTNVLADVSYVLGKSHIHVSNLCMEVMGDTSVISMEVGDSVAASTVLSQNGFGKPITDSLVIKINGEADELLRMLKLQRVKVKQLTRLSCDATATIYALSVDKPRRAGRILSEFLLGSSANNP